jgi:hypothetical protein
MKTKLMLKMFGVLLISTFSAYVIGNALAGIYYKQLTNPVADKYGYASLEKVYPGKSHQEIDNLLAETWSRPFLYEPFTEFKERPYHGDYVNVDENGFRFSRDQASSPPAQGNINIFVFGGSTTFGYGVADSETIPSRLQEEFRKQLGAQISVYNFGRGYYFSTQERVLFEKLVLSGYVPNVAIFIDGLNDFYQNDGEPLYAPEFELMMNDPTRAMAQALTEKLRNLPIVRAARDAVHSLSCLVGKCVQKGDDGARSDNTLADTRFRDPTIISRTINRYLSNKKLVEAVSAAYDIKPIFVWQPIPTYKYNPQSHLFADAIYDNHGYSIYGYPAMLEEIARRPPGDNFLWCADIQEGINEPLYVDQVHYTSAFSKVVASCIATLIIDRHLFTGLAASQRLP